MCHCSDDRPSLPSKETEVTPGKRNWLAASGVTLVGVTLSASIFTGSVQPDQATAIATTAGTVATSVALITRRPTGDRAQASAICPSLATAPASPDHTSPGTRDDGVPDSDGEEDEGPTSEAPSNK